MSYGGVQAAAYASSSGCQIPCTSILQASCAIHSTQRYGNHTGMVVLRLDATVLCAVYEKSLNHTTCPMTSHHHGGASVGVWFWVAWIVLCLWTPLLPPRHTAPHQVAALDMAILSHTGEEHSVAPPAPQQEWGNPLRLRRALDHGYACGVQQRALLCARDALPMVSTCRCKVIAAHCATEGSCSDLDNGGRRTPAFDLWLRMMGEAKYKGLLYVRVVAVGWQKQDPLPWRPPSGFATTAQTSLTHVRL